MIKLVVFDMDGVITSTTDEHFTAWRNLFYEHYNIEIDPALEARTKGVSRMESLDVILNHYQITLDDSQRITLADEKNKQYQDLISKYDESKLIEGVIPLLDYLRKAGIKLALGSASRNGPFLLKCLGIETYFDYVVDPSILKSKPDPDIFLNAMANFNLLPSECMGIEDAVAGVEAIKRAGMIAFGVGPENLPNADIYFSRLIDLDPDKFGEIIKMNLENNKIIKVS